MISSKAGRSGLVLVTMLAAIFLGLTSKLPARQPRDATVISDSETVGSIQNFLPALGLRKRSVSDLGSRSSRGSITSPCQQANPNGEAIPNHINPVEPQNITALQNTGKPLSRRLIKQFDILRVHPKLNKRFDDSSWQAAVKAGNQLYCLLDADISSATSQMGGKDSQSSVTDYNTLAQYGYIVSEFPSAWVHLDKYQAMADSLGISTNNPPNTPIRIMHSANWNNNGQEEEVSEHSYLVSP
jgi:hypothetical protein